MYAYGSHTCNPNKVRVDGLPSLSPSPKNAIDPEEVVAQERMYDLRGKMDSLRAIIDLADKHYEQTIEERRALLYKFPGLRFGTREKAAGK
jgi:hypothetical protein